MTQNLIRVLAFLFIILFYSCTSSKKLVNLPSKSKSAILAGLQRNYIDYDFFYGKAKIKFNGEESKVGGRSRIIMAKDSLIWMNFKKLTIEGARALITPDSTWVIYRLDDLYEAGPTQEFFDYYRIYRSFGEMQDLLIGNFPIPNSEEDITYNVGPYHEIQFRQGGDEFTYWINEDLSIFRVQIKDVFGRQIRATFSEYNDDRFATKKEFEIYSPEEGKSTITIKLTNVEFNVPREIKFDIPDHYILLP